MAPIYIGFKNDLCPGLFPDSILLWDKRPKSIFPLSQENVKMHVMRPFAKASTEEGGGCNADVMMM